MAEAHNAIEVFEEQKRGAKLFISDDGIEVHFIIPHPRELRQRMFYHFFRTRNAIYRKIYPGGPFLAIITVSIFTVIVTLSSEESKWRNNNLSYIIWLIGNYITPFSHLIHPTFYLAYLTAWTTLFCFFILMFIQRKILCFLLSYRGFLYLAPNEKSVLVVIWATLLKLFIGKKKLQTYSLQNVLPKLPLPTLNDTVKRYLESIHPLLNEKEYIEYKDLAHKFLIREGPRLQKYLYFRNFFSSNYVSCWWEKYVYLRNRNSLMINSNYYVLDSSNYIPTTHQLSRAAGLIYNIMKFRQLLLREQLEPLFIRNIVPVCMEQYKRLFSTTRIPGKEEDRLKKFSSAKSRHIVILYNDMYYKLPLYSRGTHGKLLTPYEIYRQLVKIKNQSINYDISNDSNIKNIAVLTSDNRFEWAENREKYFSDGKNKMSLDVIESSIFILVLDNEETTDFTNTGRLLLHGNGGNRWFDKSFNVVVFTNGKAGINGEHSWGDAPVIAHMWEYVCGCEFLNQIYDNENHLIKYNNLEELTSILPACKLLTWQNIRNQNNKDLQSIINHVYDTSLSSIQDLDLVVICYRKYGKSFIKKKRLSPDGFIQIALQLAYFKTSNNKFTQTYESSMTRLYKNGRTETVRPVTNQVKDFVLSIYGDNNENITTKCKIERLRRATEKHQQNYRDAMYGKGIDRHLFALYCVALGMNVETSFLKKVFSLPWYLSTSQQPQEQTSIWRKAIILNQKNNSDFKIEDLYSPGGGFGPVAKLGYGISYMIGGENQIFFHISSYKSAIETSSKKFAKNLTYAFDILKDLLDE